MKSLMQHHAVARAVLLHLALGSSACSMDLSLGDLSQRDQGLVDDGASASVPAPPDGVVSSVLPRPDITFADDDATISPTNITAADLDADGFDDLAIVSFDWATNTQYVNVRYGGPRLADDAQAFAFDQSGGKLVFPGPLAGSVAALSDVGDVDGDGYADLFLATTICPGLEAGNGGYLIYGRRDRFDGIIDIADVAAQFVPHGGEVCDDSWPMYSFAAPGDLDGDGFSDLVFAHSGPGAVEVSEITPGDSGVYIFYGRAERFAAITPWSSADAHLSSALSGDLVREVDSFLVHAAGDLDGDGRAELAIDYMPQTFYTVEPAPPHELLVLPGQAERWAGDVDVLTLPNRIREALVAVGPTGVPALGDLDGDGFDELIALIAPETAPVIFYGAPDLLTTPLHASRASARLLLGDFGSVVPLGDIDGDGDAELGVQRDVRSAPRRVDGADFGVLSGSRERLSGDVAFPEPSLASARIYTDDPNAEDRLLSHAQPVGDLDGDGVGDLLTQSTVLLDDLRTTLYPRLHIHYGKPVSAAPSDVPR